MTPAGPFAIVVVLSFGLAVSAQVNNTSDPPKAPTYTPEQILGTSSPRGSSTNTDSSRESAPAQPLPPLPRAPTPQPAAPAPSSCSPATNAPPNASAFPGVSASQFPRAGVSADAFTRPGVSAEQLRTLAPGGQASPCSPPRDPVLHPDPVNPPRRIPSSIDEQQGP
jgi:hypothetical protein